MCSIDFTLVENIYLSICLINCVVFNLGIFYNRVSIYFKRGLLWIGILYSILLYTLYYYFYPK